MKEMIKEINDSMDNYKYIVSAIIFGFVYVILSAATTENSIKDYRLYVMIAWLELLFIVSSAIFIYRFRQKESIRHKLKNKLTKEFQKCEIDFDFTKRNSKFSPYYHREYYAKVEELMVIIKGICWDGREEEFYFERDKIEFLEVQTA